MHAILKKVNDKFVIEWNKDKRPFIPNGSKYGGGDDLRKWQKNTKLIDFASEIDRLNLTNHLFFNNEGSIENIDVSDCVEVKEDSLIFKNNIILEHKAYFKQPKEVVNENIEVVNILNEVRLKNAEKLLKLVITDERTDITKSLLHEINLHFKDYE